MKTILHILFILLGMRVAVAQTNTNKNAISPSTQNPNSGINTPLIVTTKFNTEHPNTTALWQRDGDNYAAEYRDIKNNSTMIITYDAYGNLVRTETEVDKTGYPENINEYYKENYPTENFKVWSCEDEHGGLSYYSKRTFGTLLFDKNGYFLTNKPHNSTATR